MVITQLYRADEEYLSSHDAIVRIAPAFRHVIIDRARGEVEYTKEWNKCIAVKAPEPILRSYSLANCRTIWVEVADGDGPDDWLGFALWSQRDIFIEFASEAKRDRLRPTLRRLGALLGYEVDEA